eukprot:7665591-Alexandrium_andersonii.AAC.1
MSASLVGSEMCIRDSCEACGLPAPGARPVLEAVRLARAPRLARAKLRLLSQLGRERKNSCCSKSTDVSACM